MTDRGPSTDQSTTRPAEPLAARGAAATRPRWWCDARVLAAVLLATLGATLAWGLFGPEPAIVVSPTTTFLTAPCAADGLPDYEAALIASAAPLPSAEENVAAELLLTFWPF
jgi:hypothetical protein